MKHTAKVRLAGLIALGLGLSFAPNFDSFKRSSAEEYARSVESSGERPRGTAYLKPGIAQESTGVAFENFRVVLEPEEEEIDVKGSFTLGAGSNGIDLFKEKTAIKLGSFSAIIPAGSFKQGPKGKAEFQKLIDCKYWDLFIRSLGKNTFEFNLELQGGRGDAKLKPEDVVLSIGDDGGRAKPGS